MACSLNNKENHLEFLAITALELKEKSESLGEDENIDIEQYVRDIHQEYIDDEFSEEDAAQYAQFVPNAIKLALSYGEIAFHIDTKKLGSLVRSFEEFENVLMFTMPKINQERIDEIIESIKKDGQEIKDPPPTSSTEVQEQSEEVVETQEYKGRAHILTGTTGQEGIVDETKPPGKGYTDVRNPEEEFYYGIFRVFTEAMGKQRGVLPADLEINGHTGFKLKIISKKQVLLNQARLSDQRLVRGEIPGISAREGGRLYYGGIGAVLTDAAGNMLYFDKNYKITTKSKGKLIYHNLRNVTKNKSTGALKVTGYQLQSIENSMSYYFTATDKYSSIKELKEKNKTAYDTLKAYVESVRETQKELMYQVRNFVTSNKKDSVLVDITGISRGFLNIEKSANTDINSIDWANSDVKLSVTIADINNDELGEVAGNPYIRIPNSKSIPFQRNNLGTEQVEGIINLLFDDIMQVTRGKKSSIPNDLKETLITNLIRLDKKGIQIINNNKEWKVKLKTKKLTGTEEDRQAIRTFLSTLSNERNSYNNEWGKFRFKKPTGNNIKEFTITDGVATITNKAFSDHVIENSTLEVKPNTKNQILFLNGYFTFNVPLDEQAKFGTELEEKEIPAITEEDLKAKNERQAGVIKKTVKDYFDNSKDSVKNLKEGVKAVQQIIKKNGTDWESYTESDQKVIKETFTNIAKVIPQVAALILPVPGTATLLQILKSKSKAINKLLTYTFQALENYKSTASVGDAEATEKVLDDIATDYAENFKVGKHKGASVYKGKGLILERQSNMVSRILGESGIVNENMRRGATVGNFVDVLARDMFNDAVNSKTLKQYLKEANKANIENGYTLEITEKQFTELKAALQLVKDEMVAANWTFKSEDIFVYSEYSEAEKKASGYDGVGGMLDLVGIDPSGTMHIVDFKNIKFTPSKKGFVAKNVYSDGRTSDGVKIKAKVLTWANQQTVYKFLAEKEHDLNVGSTNILPISTIYSETTKKKLDKKGKVVTPGVVTLDKFQLTAGVKGAEVKGLIDVREQFKSDAADNIIQLEEGEVLAEVEKKFEETSEVDNIDYIDETLYNKNVNQTPEGTEFVNVYRAEGKVVDRENLPLSVRGNAGSWFTPFKAEVERYAAMGNRKVYKIAIPKVLYDNLLESRKGGVAMSKGEIQLPPNISSLKTEVSKPTQQTSEVERREEGEYIIYEDKNNKSSISFIKNTLKDGTYLQVNSVDVPSELQGKGIGTSLYTNVLNNLPTGILGIVSGTIISPAIKKIYKNLETDFNVTKIKNTYIVTLNKPTQQASEVEGQLSMFKEPTQTPAEKVEEIKEIQKEQDKKPPTKEDPFDGINLYADRLTEIKSSPEVIAESKEWFENHVMSEFIGYEELFDVVNSNAFAEFIDGGIRLYKGSDHTVLYHEAWHGFTQHFLPTRDKLKLYNETFALEEGQQAVKDWAKKKNVNILRMSQYQKYLAIEEFLAEDFRQYKLSGDTKVFGKNKQRETIFRRIMNFLKHIFGKLSGIKSLSKDYNTYQVQKMYKKLSIGAINEYTHSAKNMMFTNSALYKAIEPVEGNTINISDQDSLKIVSAVDSIISGIIDTKNKQLGNTMFTSALFTMPEVIMKSGKTLLETMYGYIDEKGNATGALGKFIDRRDALLKEADALKGVKKKRITDKAGILSDAINNWGNLREGVIAYHVDKSPFLGQQLKNIDKDTFTKTKEDVDSVRFDKAGNDLSMMDLTSNQVLYLIKSIKDRQKDGTIAKDEFGFDKLVDYKITWKKLIDSLDENNDSPREIHAALIENSKENPWMNDLLNKLGPVVTVDQSSFDLWTGFWSAFYLANWGLYQVSAHVVQEEEGQETGARFEILVGYASAVFKQAERDFRGYFKQVKNHKYITNTSKGNELNWKVLDEYRGTLTGNEFQFLKDIGIPITDKDKIKEGLKDVRVDRIYDTLKRLRSQGVVILDVIEALKLDHKFKDEKSGNIIPIASEAGNINKILNLETRHSGVYANTAVGTPDGKIKFEQTQMSTLSVQQRAINKSKTFDELVALPHMAHLNYKNNPGIIGSTWMKSLYEFNDITKLYGKKIPGVEFKVDDLSGTQTIVNKSYADLNYSSATSKSDKYTRLIQDIYSGLLDGRFSTMVHADKSTVLAAYITTLNVDSDTPHLYIDPKDFTRFQYGDGDISAAVVKAFDMLMPYLEGELTRIARVESKDSSLPRIPGYTIKDKKGNISGNKLAVFDNIFIKTKDEILKAGSVENIYAISEKTDLADRMLSELQTYFDWSTKNTKETLGQMIFADETMTKFIKDKTGNQSMPLSEVQDVMLETYTMNTFLHHIESINIMYGDLAQYNMLKEEFHKRNAGIASTGRMFRTDQDAYDYINNPDTQIGRPLAEKLGYKVKDFDGTLDTAVLKENIIPSKMVTHPKGILFSPYGIALKKDIKKKYPKAEAAKVKTMVERILKPYTAMEEGDGQGWMSFDTYRILSMLSNRWTKAQEMLFNKIIKDPESVSLEDVHEYFPPRKYQYFGPLAVENIGATAFHKYSLVPIIPSVITGKNMEVLHDNMMKQGIDYAVFDSGSKVSTVVSEGRNEGDQLYIEGSDREMLVRDDSPEQMYAKNTIFLNYLKDQLDINSHFKNKVIFSTQMRKLIEEGLVEGGVPVDFMEGEDFNLRRLEWHNLSKYANDSAKREAVEKKKRKISPNYKLYREYEETIIEAIEYRKEELRQEIGSTEKELAEGKGDMDKLVNFIRRELDRQDLADHEIDFIKSDENGNMVYDLSMTPSASRIERALNAIVNNRIIRQKVNGEPLVQIAGTMFEAKNPTKQDLENYGDATNDLKTYIVGPDGNTLGMEVKVALQGNFEVLIHLRHEDGDKIAVYVDEERVENGKVKFTRKLNETATIARLNETINNKAWRSKPSNAELITMTGVRIPVQGHNSMEFMLIKEFLPKAAGNIIIPPSEIVAKSGSDFDIDKLTIMMANIAVIGGVPEVIKETRLSSVREKFDRTKEIKVELKELRKSIAEATLAYENAYDKLSKDGLTDEEAVSVKQMKETYQTERDLLNKELNTAIFNEERLEAYEKLTDNQYKLLEEAKETIQYTGISKEILAAEYARETSKFGSEIRQKNIDKLNNSELVKAKEKLQDKYNDLLREVKSYSGEAIENTLMYAIRDILQLPQNFINLITPNDTNLLQGEGSIVEDLAQFRDYKSTTGVGNVSTGSVSPTRVLEPAYNIYKHESNAVGKDTLGLAAIDNTYNTVLTRIGAYLNPTYFNNNKSRRAVIKMEHNKLNILEGAFKGKEGISLSHLYDVKGENKVSDVINQLLNGWLDVAKDAWIFDIQGNKQITPTLMFLLQAGVPLETAIYFVSNPLVKEYVTQQKIATSAYARFLGVQPENDPTHYRSHAKDIVLDDLNLKMSAKDLYDETVESTEGKDFTDSAKDIAHMSYVEAKYDADAKAAFLHFLELEKTSEGIKDIKMKMNYDTAQSTDLFDAQRKEADLRQLYADSKTPNQVVDGILNDSTIGGFRIADFQLSLWGPLFKIRSHKELNDFLIQRLSSDSNKMKKIYYTEERYVEEFKNAFIMRMFSKAIKDFDINADSYKGLPIRRTIPVESIKPQTSEVEVTSSKNIFTVEPIQAADKKAKSKAKIATQYIGFAEGIAGSSTASYAKQAGQFANTGAYTSDDVIFVSIGGKRGSAALQKSQQDRTIKEAIKAVEAGATIITDNKRYTDASTYNTGEKRLYENMKAKGYYYSEVNVDGNTLGTWSKPTQQSSGVERKGTINVYWGGKNASKSENHPERILSNLAQREFTWKERKYGSVEHAYQSNKSGTFDQATYNKYEKIGGYGSKIRGKGTVAEMKAADSLDLMKQLVVESFKQNSNSEATKVLMQYENFTHNTNQLIDQAFLEGLVLAQQELESTQTAQPTRKGVTPIHSDRGVIVKPNAKGEMTIYISEDVLERQFNGKLYQRDGSFTTGIDKVADRKFNYKTLGLAKVEEVAFLYGTAKLAPKKTEYFRFVIEREFLRVTNPFSEMSKTRYFEYKYNANKKKYKKPANTTQEDFETRLLKFTYEEMLRDSALNNILNYWKLFMSKDSMANQLIEMKEMNPTLEEDYNVVNDLILSEGKVQSKNDLKGKRNKAQAYTNIVLRDNKVDKDMVNVYHSNLLDLADPSKRKITISRKNTEQDKIENQRISEFFKMLPLVAFLQSGLNTMDNLSITRIIPTQQITDLIDPLINDYIKELDKPNSRLLLNFYNQFNAVNNISNISIRKRLQNYVTIDNKESVSYNLTNSNVVAEHSIPMNFEDGTGGRKMISKFKNKSTFDLIISGDRTGTSRSPRAKKNVKRGDIIEFTKDIPEKRDAQGRVIRKATVRQLLVRATSDEYPVSDVSSKTWSELEGWDLNGYSKIVDLDYVQFTFELLDVEELADKKIKEEGVGFIEIGPANKNELEILIKNNPNVIFVLEGSTSSTEKGSYVEGMGKIGEFNNVVNIDLRNSLSNNKQALWNITDNEKNKVIIDESMTRLEEVFNTDKSIALLSPRIGYGAYLASTSPSGSMVSSPTFDHLSSELYAKFKYNNKNSNVFGNVQTLMKESQQVDDFQLEIPIEDLIEARERLTCK
jgi:predicted GNAT family acetyltransferase